MSDVMAISAAAMAGAVRNPNMARWFQVAILQIKGAMQPPWRRLHLGLIMKAFWYTPAI
ncbi:MAG TPA: hypothetical protein VIY90_17035 [Steroidobacteraceae bacterium]